MGTEGRGRAIHDKDCVLCWLVINKSSKLSSALFLHIICILEEGIEILWVTVLMVQLSRCTFLLQSLLLVITLNVCEIWQEPQASPSCEVQLKTKPSAFASSSAHSSRWAQQPALPVTLSCSRPSELADCQTESLPVQYLFCSQASGLCNVIWPSITLEPVWFLAPTSMERPCQKPPFLLAGDPF